MKKKVKAQSTALAKTEGKVLSLAVTNKEDKARHVAVPVAKKEYNYKAQYLVIGKEEDEVVSMVVAKKENKAQSPAAANEGDKARYADVVKTEDTRPNPQPYPRRRAWPGPWRWKRRRTRPGMWPWPHQRRSTRPST